MLPKCSDKAVAASLPDGSISPWKQSQIVRTSPSNKLAVVPPYDAAKLETVIYSIFGSILYLSIIYKQTYNVITFVKLAISLLFYSNLPEIVLLVFKL